MTAEPENISFFHHALRVIPDKCIGCTHCMKACPTGAIRVRDGLAVINDNKCIDCGECAISCPENAIIVEQDDLPGLESYKARIALVPGVFFGQFPERIPIGKIYAAIKKIGFTHVFEVENTIGFILDTYEELRLQNPGSLQISSFCPAVIRLIQVRFPALVRNIAKVKPPIDLAASYMRRKLAREGFPEDETGVFYVTPCAAKIASVKSPVDEEVSAVNGVINMQFMYNLVYREIHNSDLTEEEDLKQEMLSSEGILWSLTGGEIRHQQGRALAIDGIHNVNAFLERLENEEFEAIDFLELRACDQGCAGGLLISGNRFLTVERLNKRAGYYPPHESKSLYKSLCPEDKYLGQINPRPIDPLDRDMSGSIKKMAYKQKLVSVLPGIDCGACGAPDCQSLAEDIARGVADVSDCVFLQREMVEKAVLSEKELVQSRGKIWGENRFKMETNNNNENS